MGSVFNMVGSGSGSKANIAGAIITLGPAPVYDGTEKTQTVIEVELNGIPLRLDADYYIGNNTGTDAGNYELVVVGCNNFEGSVAKAWAIEKASLTRPTVSGSPAYTGSEITVPLVDYNESTMALSGETTGINVGAYTVYVNLDDSTNYQWSDGSTSQLTLSWRIQKAAGTLVLTPPMLELTADKPSGSVEVSRLGDGAISVSGYDSSLISVVVSDTTITATAINEDGGDTEIVVSVAEGTSYLAPSDVACPVSVRFTQVFGVEWNYASTSTALTRLTTATDPNGHVNVDITTEPSPAVGTGAGSSPFDAFLPWSGMTEFNIIDNAVSYQKGEEGFSRTNYDTVVRIPRFWYKIETDTANSKMRFYIADGPEDGFEVHGAFARGDGVDRDCIYVGRYHTISGYFSKSGAKPLASITRATARTNSASKGTNWWQYDYAALTALQLLYLVEFADWDSQSKIGQGFVSGSATQNTGGTDSMTYHTGRAAGTDGQVQAQYRGVEEMWGNILDWIDGCNFNNRAAYVCLNPANFADDTATNYTAVGLTLPSSNGYIKRISASTVFPWAIMPTEQGGSATTYVPDYVNSGTGWRVLYAGGNCGSGASAGAFYFHGCYASSVTYAFIGARLLYLS